MSDKRLPTERGQSAAVLTTSSSNAVDASHAPDFQHVTVLRDAVTQAVVTAAAGRETALVIDCTLGGGGVMLHVVVQ